MANDYKFYKAFISLYVKIYSDSNFYEINTKVM